MLFFRPAEENKKSNKSGCKHFWFAYMGGKWRDLAYVCVFVCEPSR